MYELYLLSGLGLTFRILPQEYEEKKLIEQNTDAERRKLQKQHDKDMDEVRREFTRKKDTLAEQLEDEVWKLTFEFSQLLCLKFGFITLIRGLSGRVLDSRPRGRRFEPLLRHCVVVLEQDTFILA